MKLQHTLVLLLAAAALRAAAEPPALLSVAAGGESRPAAGALPIPSEATEEQRLAFAGVIAEAQSNDVSITEQAAVLYKGLMLTQDEEYEAAIPFLEEALRRDPSQQPGWEGLGWAYIKTGQLERATRLWRYFQRLVPDQSLPYSLLAQASILHQDWKQADANFKKSLAIDPGQYDVSFWYAQNLMRVGEAEEAEAVFRELIERDPDRLDVQINLAALLTQRLEYDEAVGLYRDINKQLPGNPKFMLEQATLELRVGELRAADQLCLDVLEIDPGSVEAMRLRADIAEIDGQQDLRPLREVIDETADPVQKSALLVRLATRCHLVNQRSPGTYDTSFILGLMARAITNDAGSVDTRVLYAERLVEANRLGAARGQATAVLERYNRHNTRAKMVLFEIAIREKRYEDAEQILADRFGNYDASDPMAYYYRARIYAARGMYQEALAEIDKMEAAANQGCVLTLLYHDLTESDWTPVTSVRRLHEHIFSLQREGWTLVSPADIPGLVGLQPGESRADPAPKERPPATARAIDYLRWCVTGTRKFEKAPPEDGKIPKPRKFFAVTFDDDLRSSLALGTDVARDFGVPFGIFMPTEPVKEYTPSRAGWAELRKAADSGLWIVGSELHATYRKKPVDEKGDDVRSGLSNRLWLPGRGRQESMNEWDRRMRREFRDSRGILRRELGERDSPVAMVAYPYGDIGQEGACNLAALRNPMQTILSEAARTYQLGFVQSASGYTVAGDNLLLARRYQPSWTDEGSDVVRHAYEYHPAFIARKMRAEIAMLMNRPGLAQTMVDALRRDGYPVELCRRMEVELHAHFRNKPGRDLRPLVADDSEAVRHEGRRRRVAGADDDDPGAALEAARGAAEDDAPAGRDAEEASQPAGTRQEGSIDPYLRPRRPFVGAELVHSKANDQIETVRYGVRGGLDLNPNTTLSAEYLKSDFDQTIRPHWNAQVTTNVPYAESKYKFKMERREYRVLLSHRLESGAVLSASAGRAERRQLSRPLDGRYYSNLQDELNKHVFTLDGDDECTLLSLGASFNPGDNLHLFFYYDRDFVGSAVKNLVYDSVGGTVEWKPEDSWFVKGHAQYWTYEDDNAMFSAAFDSLWELSPDLGVWGGLQYTTITTSHPSDFYWTPYWDRRVMGVLRYQQSREGYNLRFDLLAGMQGEKGRADRAYEQPVTEEREVLVDGVANTVTETKTEFVIAEDASTGWHRAWGVSAKFEKELSPHFSISLEGEIVALREYIDHFVLLYFKAGF